MNDMKITYMSLAQVQQRFFEGSVLEHNGVGYKPDYVNIYFSQSSPTQYGRKARVNRFALVSVKYPTKVIIPNHLTYVNIPQKTVDIYYKSFDAQDTTENFLKIQIDSKVFTSEAGNKYRKSRIYHVTSKELDKVGIKERVMIMGDVIIETDEAV